MEPENKIDFDKALDEACEAAEKKAEQEDKELREIEDEMKSEEKK